MWVFPPPHQLFVSLSAFTLFFPFLPLARSRALSLKVTPTRFPPTPAGSSAFLFCALGLASCCVLLCRVRDLCHTECKYMSKHAKHFTDHDMSRHTHMHKASICVTYEHIYTHLCMCACVQMGSLAIVCRHDMCALLMQRPKHSRSSNKPHMNGIHFDRLRRILMNRGQMNVYAWCAIIKCFRLMRMFRKLPAKTVK